MSICNWGFTYDTLLIKKEYSEIHTEYILLQTDNTNKFYYMIEVLEETFRNQKENWNKMMESDEYGIEYRTLEYGSPFELDFSITIIGYNGYKHKWNESNIETPYLCLLIEKSGENRNNHIQRLSVDESFVLAYCEVARDFYREKERRHFQDYYNFMNG